VAQGTTWRRLGFVYAKDAAGRLSDLQVPLLPVIAATALAPLLWFSVFLRRGWITWRRLHAGLCPECGYDLRASRSSGRCPECGGRILPAEHRRPAGPRGSHRGSCNWNLAPGR
jgi:hypothetical protein